MGRCILVVIILVPFLLGASGTQSLDGTIPEVDNVIIIVVDTLAAQHLGFMGYERDTTPFMDELASRSVVLTRAYTPKSTTVPSFTTLLSAYHPTRHGVMENGVNLPPDIHFLTDNFREAGLTTWGIPAARVIGAQYGLDRGFDYYANTPATAHSAEGVIDRIERILTGSPRFREPNYLEASEPIFLMIHFYDPHTPFTPDEGILPIFADPGYDGIVDGTGDQFLKYSNYELEFDEKDIRHVRDLYDAEIRTFDQHLKELLALLDWVGLMDNSVIVFTADHGENLGEHHFITHGHPYEKSLHIPLFFHFPNDHWAGTRIDEVVENTDIIPTLMDLMDINVPDGVDGRSLLRLIDPDSDGEYFEREYLYAIGHPTDGGRTYSVFDGSHRLIVDIGNFGDVGSDEDILLYDITNDPGETANLMRGNPDVFKHLAPILGRMVIESHEGYAAEVDPYTREMLASLGYL